MKKRSLKIRKDIQKEIDMARSASARYGNFLAL
ncbi:MAG: Uncharacterized protein XE02_0550 [Mesotoga infera]|jgi:hypothetical protein|uniref:Uncharacterized protein n=1 Tax=Mesotoga infera TaxID=1236046 RepID=A0A101GZK5_9BACT|nr:MAG: Uncharacterized protein XD86_0774 [Mesotoga infera]KUK90420.1 MAG: Uncharacterized protein XE02_0550 [Mesotoga infera]